MKKIKNTLKKPIFWIILVVILIGGYFLFSNKGNNLDYDFVEVKMGDLYQEVSITGDVEPIEGVDLAFERSGRVNNVLVDVSDEVYRGQSLVLLNISDLYAELNQVEASLEVEKAKLAEIKRGPTESEIEVKESYVEEARQDLNNKYESILTTVEDAYAQADDAVRTKTAELFKNLNNSYVLNYGTCNSSDENQANFARLQSEDVLIGWRESIDSFNSEKKDDMLVLLDEAQENLKIITNFLNEVSDTLAIGCELTDSEVTSYRTKLSTARNNVNTILSELNSLEQSIALKITSLDKKQKELNNLLIGATSEEIQAQEAAVNRAEANVNNIKAQIEKGILRAPFSGKITKIDVNVGEIVDAYNPVVSIISESGFKIKVNIPEVDVSKVKIGNKASVTLDAYGEDEIFEAEVISIDSGETTIEGVSTYGASLEFKEIDDQIRSGMTANVDILTASKSGVLYIPRRAVLRENEKQLIRVIVDEEIKKVEVETGLKSSDGNIEIISGLEEGDKVVTFVK